MFKLIKYLKDYKKEVTLGPIFKLFEAILELMVPLVMAKIIDIGIRNSNIPYIMKMGSILILLGVVGLASAIICQYYASKASQGFGTILRSEVFSHITSLSHKEIDELGTSSLINRITTDVNQLQVAVAMAIRLGTRTPFIIIGSAIMGMIINLKLSLIFIAIIPLIILSLYLVMSKSIPFYKTIQKKLDRVSLITGENLEGVRVIRAFSNQKQEGNRFNKASEDLMDMVIKVGKISALLNPLTFVIMNLAIVFIIWYGGISVNNGAFTQGEIIAFINYMTQILLTLVVVANLVIIFTKASASANRINEILEIESSVKENIPKESDILSNNPPKIEFKNVSFSYNSSHEYSLTNISFTINKGEKVGIIGGTGSGKSTLVNLIPRFYDPTKGEIYLDGINIRNYPLKEMRKTMGIVPQKAVLFTGTLRENMKWSKEDASDEDILEALEIAQGSELLSTLSNGLDSEILQGGKNLSGGQKQRLTIARALVSSPELLILDDSSSALDFSTDAKLRKAINNMKEKMTLIIISQRASSIKDADKILVLDEGYLCDIGTHEELLNRCEVYREICLSQLSKEEGK